MLQNDFKFTLDQQKMVLKKIRSTSAACRPGYRNYQSTRAAPEIGVLVLLPVVVLDIKI